MRKIVVWIILSLPFLGCTDLSLRGPRVENAVAGPRLSKSQEDDFSDIQDYQSIEIVGIPGGLPGPDDWLEYSCQQIGAQYKEGKHLCLCADSQVFIFSINLQTGAPQAECKKIELESAQDAAAIDFTTQRGEISLSLVGYSSDALFRSDLEETPRNLSAPSLLRPIHTVWFGNSEFVRDLAQGASHAESFASSRRFLMRFLSHQHAVPLEHGDLPHSGMGLGMHLFATRIFLEPDMSRLKDSLMGFTSQPLDGIGFSHELVSEQGELALALREVIRMMGQREPHSNYEAHSQYGCAEYCSFSEEFYPLAGTGYFARWEKSYLSGSVYQNVVQMMDRYDRTVAQLFLTPINDLSLLATYSYSGIRHSSIFVRKERFYDRKGLKVYSRISEVDNTLFQRGSLRREIVSQTDVTQTARAVICEQGFPTLRSEDLSSKLVPGPYGGVKGGQSFFGWVKSSDQRSPLFWSGTNLQSFFSPGTLYYESSPDHAKAVSQVFLNSGGEKIIPMGILDCIQNSKNWENPVFERGVKVVNLSSIFAYDAEACEKFGLARSIRESRLLWVGGSGNGAEEISRLRSYACPGNLGVVPNLMIVAPGYHDQGPIAEKVATRGIEVADIVASGSKPDECGKFAASYAVPRVAAAAARLAKEFISLSPEKIKLAILTSAFIPYTAQTPNRNEFMAVRSGGGLDVKRAQLMALELSKNWNALRSWREAEATLCKIHCSDQRFPGESQSFSQSFMDTCRSRVQERLERLVMTKLIEF